MTLGEPKMPKIDKWEVEGAADTIMRAHEIKQNPKLRKRALRKLRNRAKALKKAVTWSSNL